MRLVLNLQVVRKFSLFIVRCSGKIVDVWIFICKVKQKICCCIDFCVIWCVVSWPLGLSHCTWRIPEDADRWGRAVSGMITA